MQSLKDKFEELRHRLGHARGLDSTGTEPIYYQAASDAQLKAEVSEYVVTDHIEENFDRLLKLMQTAAQGGAPEVGVWVSGFYGSGKSSFTKYLGFALDRRKMVVGDSFLHLLQNQIKTATVRALFNTVPRGALTPGMRAAVPDRGPQAANSEKATPGAHPQLPSG